MGDRFVEKQARHLQSTLPVCILNVKSDKDYAFIDRMPLVCAALINLFPTVVPLNCH